MQKQLKVLAMQHQLGCSVTADLSFESHSCCRWKDSERVVWREKDSFICLLFRTFSEDPPIGRCCPNSGRLKQLDYLCNSMCWKFKVLCYFLLSPGEKVCAAHHCDRETDPWLLLFNFYWSSQIIDTTCWSLRQRWSLELTANTTVIQLIVCLSLWLPD